MKPALKSSFTQLIVVYTALVLLISLNLFWKYSLQMSLFALILGVMGFISLRTDTLDNSKSLLNKRHHYILLSLALLFIILLRIIPYIGNSVPLGYDAGLYKYGIEYGLQNLDSWILQGGMEPGFLYFIKPFTWILSSQFILTYLLIALCALLGIAIYLVSKEYFGRDAGLISLLIYSVSIIQFKTFWYMYYKNILGLCLALLAIYFLEKSKIKKKFIWFFVALGGFLGAVHRPTFYIFGLSYFFYAFISPYQNKKYNLESLKKNVLYGLAILALFVSFYLGKFRPALFVLSNVAQGFVQTGEAPGTFINFFTYQYATLFYLPFALIGFLALAKKKEFNMVFLWALITGIIVYFQFFFFNRFIIHLDIALIILSAYGYSILIANKRKLGIIILAVMLLSAGILSLNESKTSKPLVNDQELQTIMQLQNIEPNAFVMSTSSYYSPWLQGYSGRRVIAPGLFDYDPHSQEEWIEFWTTSDINEIKEFLKPFDRPLYIFSGQMQKNTLSQFEDSECLNIFHKSGNSIIYNYSC